MKILMVASENDALPGGKVGGIGDVLRDIPKALAQQGPQVEVVLPGYGAFSKLPGAEQIDVLEVDFAGHRQSVALYQVHQAYGQSNIVQWVMEHPLFAEGGIGNIYCDDPADRPFASDATKFSLFCAAVAKAICNGLFGQIDILHLHDWHSAMLSVLRAYEPDYKALKEIPTVYTIHNLALQGIRPLASDSSSLKVWFPKLKADLHQIIDPRYPNCINPMRSAINLSDKVHVVSSSYAREILRPSNPEQGYFGGEGLEMDLQRAYEEGRLHGILNGCEYDYNKRPELEFTELLALMENNLLEWIGKQETVKSAHMIAMTRLNRWLKHRWETPPLLLTSVSRLTEQKASLLRRSMCDGRSSIEHLLDRLDGHGVYVMLGSGDKALEAFMTSIAAKRDNFVFLNGYSQALSEQLYANGDLFLMPSSFEPCGISQMLAMRDGQPCLVHGVGGLNDTVSHLENGFVFTGSDQCQQVESMLQCLDDTLSLLQNELQKWQAIQSAAANARFLWSDSAEQYIEKLYR